MPQTFAAASNTSNSAVGTHSGGVSDAPVFTRFFSGQLNGFLRFCDCGVGLPTELGDSCGEWFGVRCLRLSSVVLFFLLRRSIIVSAGLFHLGEVVAISVQLKSPVTFQNYNKL